MKRNIIRAVESPTVKKGCEINMRNETIIKWDMITYPVKNDIYLSSAIHNKGVWDAQTIINLYRPQLSKHNILEVGAYIGKFFI